MDSSKKKSICKYLMVLHHHNLTSFVVSKKLSTISSNLNRNYSRTLKLFLPTLALPIVLQIAMSITLIAAKTLQFPPYLLL
uniref:Uncharacterized protein n=1 Tax=Physcomitrium patens TaxID=3218 RepID=A0A2K1II43_PHYPA|nr:hypothetical protein PHYPA_027639 [Physcomitrium patens]